jgi:hypothetical protein
MPARSFPRIAEIRAYVRGGGQALSLHSATSEPAKNSAEAERTASKCASVARLCCLVEPALVAG